MVALPAFGAPYGGYGWMWVGPGWTTGRGGEMIFFILLCGQGANESNTRYEMDVTCCSCFFCFYCADSRAAHIKHAQWWRMDVVVVF